jgi:RNA polymerase sporulation-specific sigma factor
VKENSLTNPTIEYSEKETLRLVILAKEGDEASFAFLADKFKPLLDAAVAQYRAELLPQDVEELSQEALVAFHSAVKSYDPSYKNVSFGLYAKICVNKAIISALRAIWRRSRTDLIPLDGVEDVFGDAGDIDPASELIERENAEELSRRISEHLSEYENRVWWLYFSGLSSAQIARVVGRSPKSVGNALCRIKQKLRALLS